MARLFSLLMDPGIDVTNIQMVKSISFNVRLGKYYPLFSIVSLTVALAQSQEDAIFLRKHH